MERITCCVDTGPASAGAAARARRLWPAAELTLLHVAPPAEVLLGGMSEWEIEPADPAGPPRRWLEGLASAHGATALLLEGDPLPAIGAWLAVADPRPDLVVAAAHSGRVARLALGSTATELAESAPVDTLIIPPEAGDGGPGLGRIICAVDDPEVAVAVAGAARLAAGRAEATIELVHVAVPPVGIGRDLVADLLPIPPAAEHEARGLLARAMAHLGGPTDATLLAGDPADRLEEHCRERGADALVLAPDPLGFGSVAARLVRTAPCPVLLARARH